MIEPHSDLDAARADGLDSDRAVWRAACTFEDLCRLGAAFISGDNAYFPGWGWPVLDEESDEIAAHLAAFHRAGFLTLASQPGCAPRAAHDGALHEQRAFVCGFADEKAARALGGLATDQELMIALFRRGKSGGERTPVSTRGGIAYAFAGYSAFEEELECFDGEVSSTAWQALERSTYISALDLEWGRNSKLWISLAKALGSA